MKKFYLLLLFTCFFSNAQTPPVVQKMSDYPNDTFNQRINALENAPNQAYTLIIDKNVTVETDIVPNKITLKFINGFKITIPNGVTLTLNCPIEAGVYQIFECSGTGKTNGYPFIEQAIPNWWKSISDVNGSWDSAIQSAIDFYPKVFFPAREIGQTYKVSKSIIIDLTRNDQQGYVISGVGRASAIGTDSYNGYIFSCINPPLAGYYGGLKFENLTFHSYKGIQIESQVAFTEPGHDILNVKINNCRFYQNVRGTQASVAISLRKVFDSEISNNFIIGYETGISLVGSDINNIRDNRITDFYKYAISDFAFSTFGSQNSIFHNDLLGYKGPENHGAFIKSTSYHVIIKDNYLENQPPSQNPEYPNKKIHAYIDCSKFDLTKGPDYTEDYGQDHYIYHMDITGNRLDAQTNECGYNLYYINEKFKSLNLIEIPNLSEYTNGSTFCSNIDNKAVTHIPMKMNYQNNDSKVFLVDKTIMMTNCQSFKNWENFSTSKLFGNSSNGDIIIDSKSISNNSQHGDYVEQKFNSKGFLIAGNSSIFIKINDKSDTGMLHDFYRDSITVKIKIRKYKEKTTDTYGAGNATNELYFALKTSLIAAPAPAFIISNIDLPDDDAYSVFKFKIPAQYLAALNTDYYFQLHSTQAATLEVKEITIEKGNVKVLKQTNAVAKKEAANEVKEISEEDSTDAEETTQTLTVKVDNDTKMYPNPVQSNLTFDIKKGDTLKSVEVYTETGSYIGDYTNKMANNTIDISSLPNASYLVKVITISNTSKIIIKK